MAIVGHNFYLDGVKQNDTLVPVADSFTFDGLQSGTVNPDGYLVAFSNVDGAGNEGPQTSLTVKTLDATPPPPPPPVVEGPLSAADAAAVDAIVAASMAESKQPGVLVAITGPKGYYTKAYGSTAASGGRALTVDDHFRTASGAKTFTTTAFWMAVDKGLVTLDDVLEDFVPGVPEGDVIKMRNMLQMRSGVYEYTSGSAATSFVLSPTQAWSEAKTLASIKSHPSQFPPGTKYAYANSNFALIGAVVEAVDPAHRTIRNIIQDDILTPLGMAETKWPVKADGTGNPAIPAPAMSTNQFNPDILGPAGGYTTTLADYIKWAKAMRDGTLISAESLNAWHSLANFVGYPAGFPDPPPTQFGYGFGQESTGTWFGHNGSWTGFGTQCAFDSISGACMAVAENKQTTSPIVLSAYTRIFRKIAKLLYPNSMAEQDYLGNIRQPIPTTIAVVGGVPSVTVTAVGVTRPNALLLNCTGGTPTVTISNNKVVTPTGIGLRVIGASGAGALTPSGATLTVTGSVPNVSVAAGFIAFNEENTSRTNQPVPTGATGVWVTAIGGGGGGGSGRRNTSGGACGGGGGGGGGAKVLRVLVPRASLGSTYSSTRGFGGTGGASPATSANGSAGAVGTATTFTSGSVSISAGFGHGGAGGITIGGGGGAGGTASVSGVTATTSNGTSGTVGSTAATAASAGNNTTGGAGGGGGGGGTNTSDVRHAGGGGGDSIGQSGGGGGAIANHGGSTAVTASGVAGAGAGGGGASSTVGNSSGGDALGYGGGAGGGGGAQGTAGNVSTAGGDGGDGYLLVEWI